MSGSSAQRFLFQPFDQGGGYAEKGDCQAETDEIDPSELLSEGW